MNARYSYLFALALTLSLTSCRFVGTKPDFSVLGDSLTPPVTDAAYVESKPTGSVAIALPALTAPAAAPSYSTPPAVAAPLPEEAPAATGPGFFTKAYWSEFLTKNYWKGLFSSSEERVHEEGYAAAPPPPPHHTATAPAPAPQSSYTVRSGDTLARIARQHGVSLGALAAANGIDLQRPVIRPGQRLRLPGTGSTAAPAAPRASHSRATTYRVSSGDTLYRIAAKHGISLRELLRANNLNDESARRVRVGSSLIIPAR